MIALTSRRVAVSLALGLALGACSDASRGRSDDAADGLDTSSDTDLADDTNSDIANDTNSDIANDTNSDIANDTNSDIANDTNSDIANDTNSDIANDANNDISDDATAQDVSPDTDTPFVCACDYGQRCVDACTTPGDVCARDGYPDGTERRYCRPPAGVGQGCSNQFNEYYIACAEGLDCLFPLPDDADSPKACYDCSAQDVTFTGECAMPLGVFWDGTSCKSISACTCTGADCGAPYASLSACERKAEVPCSGR